MCKTNQGAILGLAEFFLCVHRLDKPTKLPTYLLSYVLVKKQRALYLPIVIVENVQRDAR